MKRGWVNMHTRDTSSCGRMREEERGRGCANQAARRECVVYNKKKFSRKAEDTTHDHAPMHTHTLGTAVPPFVFNFFQLFSTHHFRFRCESLQLNTHTHCY